MPIVFEEVSADIRPERPEGSDAPTRAEPTPPSPLLQAHAQAQQWEHIDERRQRLADD
ncbi:MAG: hypothetical protein IPG57_10145 [Burkholderiales bacterium]|jgi:hypothetical protein|nr:hypothetical protein [Burkholderiales bacterium]MBP6249923.1 hypothetical protein [Leptothrix sp. (in: b-proteobacteria)]MBP7520034.1 hypothetical protein [Leptothrix sp. (in: b-proteobacteria)]HQY07111.1 hypothetical protein [Burkholderiaceae bacterium]